MKMNEWTRPRGKSTHTQDYNCQDETPLKRASAVHIPKHEIDLCALSYCEYMHPIFCYCYIINPHYSIINGTLSILENKTFFTVFPPPSFFHNSQSAGMKTKLTRKTKIQTNTENIFVTNWKSAVSLVPWKQNNSEMQFSRRTQLQRDPNIWIIHSSGRRAAFKTQSSNITDRWYAAHRCVCPMERRMGKQRRGHRGPRMLMRDWGVIVEMARPIVRREPFTFLQKLHLVSSDKVE